MIQRKQTSKIINGTSQAQRSPRNCKCLSEAGASKGTGKTHAQKKKMKNKVKGYQEVSIRLDFRGKIIK